jgi:amidase
MAPACRGQGLHRHRRPSHRQGSAIFADSPPAAAHAQLIDHLLASGAWRIVGKAAMHELAFGVTG